MVSLKNRYPYKIIKNNKKLRLYGNLVEIYNTEVVAQIASNILRTQLTFYYKAKIYI